MLSNLPVRSHQRCDCRVAVALFLIFGLTAASSGQSPSLRAVVSAQGVEIVDGDAPVLFYQRAPKSLDGQFERAGYVHPLYGLDGGVLTEDFPDDHRHHRGIFWAWHQLMVGETRVGDPWICRDFLTDVRRVDVLPPGRQDSVAIQATAFWTSPKWVDADGNRQPIVAEETVIRVEPVRDNSRAIDFEIRLTAVERDVKIGGSDDAKGYGGFSPRIRLPDGLRFRAKYGDVTPQTESVEPSSWLDMTAPFGADHTPSGVTILCHPATPGAPQRWILRRNRSMQNPVFPGREAVALPTDQPLVLRYRIVLHRGAASDEQIEQWFVQYSNRDGDPTGE